MSLYRKYRPASFAEVVGQEQVTKPLSAALDTGRINHAYLFSGPRGCGKTSSARILARSLNCVEGPTSTPCGRCESCRALAPDGPGTLDVTELDAASHGGVDDIRELRDRAYFAPADSRYRVFIIDECHMISREGSNALLKVVEEPPEHLVFIFATTEPEKVIGTIRSRTHHYPFRLLTPQAMRGLLERTVAAEGVSVEDAVYPLVIQAGGGSPRDSLSILDQLIGGSGDGNVTYAKALPLLGVTDFTLIDATVEALAAADGARLFQTVDDVIENGIEPRRFVLDLLDRMRDLMVIQAVPEAFAMGLVSAPAGREEALRAQAGLFTGARIAQLADQINERLADMRGATSPKLLLEILLAHLLLTASAEHHGVPGVAGQGVAGAGVGGAGRSGGTGPSVGESGGASGPAGAGVGGAAPAVRGQQASRGSQAAREAIARAQAARGQAVDQERERAVEQHSAPEPDAAGPVSAAAEAAPSVQPQAEQAGHEQMQNVQPQSEQAQGGQPPSEQQAEGPLTDDALAGAVREKWAKLREAVGKANRVAQIMLAEAHVLGARGTEVVLGHNTGALAQRLNAESNNSTLVQVFSEELDQPVTVRCEVGTDPKAAGFSESAPPEPAWDPRAEPAETSDPAEPAEEQNPQASQPEPQERPAQEHGQAGQPADQQVQAGQPREAQRQEPQAHAGGSDAPDNDQAADDVVWGEPAQLGGTAAPAPPRLEPREQAEHAPTGRPAGGEAPTASAGTGSAAQPGASAPAPAASSASPAQTASAAAPAQPAHASAAEAARRAVEKHARRAQANAAANRTQHPADRFGVPLPPEPADDDAPPPPDPADARAEEEDMMREAALKPGTRDRRDALVVARELLEQELGAQRM